MREIRFRGKRKDNGEEVKGSLITANGKSYILDLEKGGFVDENENAAYNLVEVIPETVGMFTGLHDKSGREIYEGDIVFNGQMRGNGKVSLPVNCIVEWNNCEARWQWQSPETYGTASLCKINEHSLKVIGNIHEDLIEEKPK